MMDSDKREFNSLINGVSNYYEKDELSPEIKKMYYLALENYSMESVTSAMNGHVQSPTQGRFFPKIADLKKILDGGDITPDMIIAAANGKRTPLGILARIFIGSWDLNNLGSFELRQKAIECLDMIPEWRDRAAKGEYTDHELKIMAMNRVNPLEPFTNGIAGPIDQKSIAVRLEHIQAEERKMLAIEQEEANKIKQEPVNLEQQRLIFKKIRSLLDQPVEPTDGN